MKYLVDVKYKVVKTDYKTEHTSQKIYHAADAVMCLVSHLNQLVADTDGIIVDIQARVNVKEKCHHEFDLPENKSTYPSNYQCIYCGIHYLDREDINE